MATSFFSETTYGKEDISGYDPIYGNYKFDTDLTGFGMMLERKFRKVNRLGNVLKLSDVKDATSIYPMLDEFGYSFSDFFIFKSSWDDEYLFETSLPSAARKARTQGTPSGSFGKSNLGT